MVQRQVGPAAMLRHRTVAWLRAATPQAAPEAIAGVVRMQDERAARFQDSPHVAEELRPVVGTANHPQGAEQTGRVVERFVRRVVEFDQIGLQKFERMAGRFRLLANDLEHRGREVDAHTLEPAGCEVHQQSARPATEVDQSAGRCEVALGEAQIRFEEWRAGQCRVVFASDSFTRDIVPESPIGTGRKLPVWGQARFRSGAVV